MRTDPAELRYHFDLAHKKPLQPGDEGWGFDGVRLFPNWWADNPDLTAGCAPADYDQYALFDAATLGAAAEKDRGIDPEGWRRLEQIIRIAIEEGVVIQLTMAMDTVTGFTWEGYKTAMRALAIRLRDFEYVGPANNNNAAEPLRGARGVFIDLQNEYDVRNDSVCKVAGTAAHIYELRQIVKAADPERYVTASRGPEPEQVAQDAQISQIDYISFHEPRPFEWQDHRYTYDWVRRVREATNNGPAVVLDEPMSYHWANRGGYEWKDDPTRWYQAAREAKAAGAAAWVWHTRAFFRWVDQDAPYSNGTLYPTELTVVTNLEREVAGVEWGRAYPVPPPPPPR